MRFTVPLLARLYFSAASTYNRLMKFFIAQNGKEVAKFVTPTGVTGYLDTSIPMGALEGLKQKLANKIAARQSVATPGQKNPQVTSK